MDNKQEYIIKKEQRIKELKSLLNFENISPEHEYEVNNHLYNEYRKFKLDSAIYYVQRNTQIVDTLADSEKKYITSLQLATLYSSSGMYLESERILKNIRRDLIPASILPLYYSSYCQFYEHYGATSYQPKYEKQNAMYRDSLLMVLDPDSHSYKVNYANALIAKGEIEGAEQILLSLLEKEDPDTPSYAIVSHLLAVVYGVKKNTLLERKYYSLSAMADIKNAIKENASFQRLAFIAHDAGDITKAFKFTQSAIEDAIFCNVQFRTAQLTKFYPIINASYQKQEASSKKQLLLYLVLISLLTLFLISLVFYIYRQMKKVSAIKETLSGMNGKLVELNNELNKKNELLYDTNNKLYESNQVKEQYIAEFFDLCSTYIDKMEEYRKSLYKLGANKQYEKLMKSLKSTTVIDNELDELYEHFDRIFLTLYPTFVSDFNSLLTKEEQIILKSESMLNKELRIYALLRLGITNSIKISDFLRCSLSTIYNYRTKLRNKAAISRDEFEDMVMQIGLNHKNKE
ncbi:DUF6377 domain-containing protein [Bacteroides sp. 224]|uniref:DUF6377 domain-containing protein n=1 Tax=Bacteroides sp. 224 TaxID=2302936 RepID=UPI001EF2011D|nr:DUF6377 domain-containing protein [Bacteroides sp. 224]